MGGERYDDWFGAWRFVQFSSQVSRHSADGYSHRVTKLLAANGEASHWTSHHAEQGEGRFSFSAGDRKIMNHFVVYEF
jgi:hypothetical protein